MKKSFVFLIALGLFTSNSISAQNYNTPITKLTPTQIKQMDLMQMEVMELSKMILNESINMHQFNQAILDMNDQLGEMGFQNFQLEIEVSVSGALDPEEFQKVFMPASMSPPLQTGPSIMRSGNNFYWLILNQDGWITNDVTPIPTIGFRIKNWRGTIDPGIASYF